MRVLMSGQIFTKPIWNELLPPPLPEPHQKPYTLLLSLDDLLVTSTWDVSILDVVIVERGLIVCLEAIWMADCEKARGGLLPGVLVAVL